MDRVVTEKHKVTALLLGGVLAVLLLTSVFTRLTHDPVRMEQGQQAQDQEQMQRVQQLMAALQDNPEHVPTLVGLAGAFLESESPEQAARFARKALDIKGDHPQALMYLATSQYRTHAHEEAARTLRQLLEITPDDPWVRYNLGIVLKYNLEQPEAATEHFRKAREDAASHPDLLDRLEHELEHDGS